MKVSFIIYWNVKSIPFLIYKIFQLDGFVCFHYLIQFEFNSFPPMNFPLTLFYGAEVHFVMEIKDCDDQKSLSLIGGNQQTRQKLKTPSFIVFGVNIQIIEKYYVDKRKGFYENPFAPLTFILSVFIFLYTLELLFSHSGLRGWGEMRSAPVNEICNSIQIWSKFN